MRSFLKRRPSPSLVLAFIALLAALSGTAVALPGKNKVDSGDIKNGRVTGADIKNNSVGGADVRESSIGKVPQAAKADSAATATSATNANSVGGVALNGLLRSQGCQSGKVQGFAYIRGNNAAAIPGTYTSAANAVGITNNCSGGAVQVRRITVGTYAIRFVGNPAAFAFAQPRADADPGDLRNCAVVYAGTGTDVGAFVVEVFQCADNAPRDGDVTVMLP